jgi:phosphoribosylformylglycinamidine cyclo-ligase
MGCGFVAVVPEADAGQAIEILSARHPGTARIGTVTDRPDETLGPGAIRVGAGQGR